MQHLHDNEVWTVQLYGYKTLIRDFPFEFESDVIFFVILLFLKNAYRACDIVTYFRKCGEIKQNINTLINKINTQWKLLSVCYVHLGDKTDKIKVIWMHSRFKHKRWTKHNIFIHIYSFTCVNIYFSLLFRYQKE